MYKDVWHRQMLSQAYDLVCSCLQWGHSTWRRFHFHLSWSQSQTSVDHSAIRWLVSISKALEVDALFQLQKWVDCVQIFCILIKSLGKQMEPGKYISHISITAFWSDHFGWRLESRPSKATPVAKIPSQNMDFTTSGIHNMCRMSHSTQGQDRQEALLIVEEKSLISVKIKR